jgi:RNA polymerase sigma factor (sigma-70 family)
MNRPMTDAEFLQQFVSTGSQPAFAALVERHIGWVAAVARRRVRDPHMAEDVTQAVFILLAQKAKSLTRETVLSAWLFQATRYASIAALRSERRRQRRELRAAEIMRQQSTAEADVAQQWEQQLAPELDELVGTLNGADRRAVLLRFYEQKSYVEVGDALGVSEEAARKRVTRAVDKLANLFRRRGVTVSAVLLATAMTAHVAPATASAATAGIAAATTTAALSSASTPIAASATAKSAAGLFAWAQVKAAAAVVIVATTAAAVGGGTTVAVIAQVRKPPSPPPAATRAAIAATSAPATAPAKIVTGRVVTPQDQPVANAHVHLMGTADDDDSEVIVASGITGADGVYHITPPADRPFRQVLIDAPPWAYTTADVSADGSQSTQLREASELEVTVHGPDGKPAVNVPVAPDVAIGGHFALPESVWSVSFLSPIQQQIAQRTDAAGKVRIARLPRGAKVRLKALDDRSANPTFEDDTEVADAATTTAGKPLNLAAAVTIAGRVTLPDGSPAAGVRIGA